MIISDIKEVLIIDKTQLPIACAISIGIPRDIVGEKDSNQKRSLLQVRR